ncbi:hypothetical protein ACM41_12970 [Bradyrhizobium sp. CCBAU 21362]|uniref:hypothetical protein n=1 Tax=Bradyrhizobium sp. CCBAU 21362 TaxID=1325082 RepID=UPI002305661B|nr:hypothetical protein [Bradyrhizobium sp. CCBAU 21362]MDA9537125.1 hypothetical protein [Bradyrhizobium sp. CCBAU 21362]
MEHTGMAAGHRSFAAGAMVGQRPSRKLMRRKCQDQSAVVKALTNGLAAKDWRTGWRQATNEKLISRLDRVQARPRDAGFILTQGCALRPTVPNLRA